MGQMKLLMDVHMPIAVTRALRRAGIDCVTSQDLSVERLPDDALLVRATELGRIVVTQDDDFLAINADFQLSGKWHAGIIYSRHSVITIGQLVADLSLMGECMDSSEVENRITYLPL